MKLEDLRPFCSTVAHRTALHRPFTHKECTYATDGRILVKTPFIEGTLTIEGAPSFESLEALLPKDKGIPVEYPPDWESLAPISETCYKCKGTGAMFECPTCDGVGEVECDHCGHESTCEDCHGIGTGSTSRDKEGAQTCDSCDGTGSIDSTLPVSLNRGKMFVNITYLRNVFTLPNVQAFISNSKETQLLHFTFDEGEGVLMPLRNDSKAQEVTDQQWNQQASTTTKP
jgi:hypothetical protein